MQVYAVYDAKAGTYGSPFYQMNDAMATRLFANLANDEQTTIGRNPEDFSLIHIGEYDDQDGKFKQKKFNSIATASALVKVQTMVKQIEKARMESQGKELLGKDFKEVDPVEELVTKNEK